MTPSLPATLLWATAILVGKPTKDVWLFPLTTRWQQFLNR